MSESKKRRPWRTGPKPLPPGEKRTKRFSVSMRAADYEILVRSAALAHRDVSVYVRDLCLGTAMRVVPPLNVHAWQRLCVELDFLQTIANFVENKPVFGDKDIPRLVEVVNKMVHRLRAALLGIELEFEADKAAFDGVGFDAGGDGASNA